MWAVGWQGAQDAKRSERPRPFSAGAAARIHARTYDMKLLTLTLSGRTSCETTGIGLALDAAAGADLWGGQGEGQAAGLAVDVQLAVGAWDQVDQVVDAEGAEQRVDRFGG